MRTFSQIIRRGLISLKRTEAFAYHNLRFTIDEPEEVQNRIFSMLNAAEPCMIARFGSVELQSIVDYLYPPTLKNVFRFIKSEIPSWGYAPSTMRTMRVNAGFFPASPLFLNRFGDLMLECMPQVDILGSWRREEEVVMQYMPNVIRVPLFALEPYYFDDPWTPALEGKRVLVIHPFEDTIQKQHKRYELLFADKRITPKYELQTLKAVQSIAGNKPSEFSDWFQALDWMKGEIEKRDFDIAIIGCGAYGFPLAAYVKQIGRKAIHLGGAVQNMFGVRSLGVEKSASLSKMVNEYWVRPSDDERPSGFERVEDGLYW